MAYVIAAPEMMTAAAGDLRTIGSMLIEEHTAAAALTVGLIPAAADEVSASIAHLFSQHAANYQAIAAHAAAFQEQFVQHLKTGAGSYAGAEAAAAASLPPPPAPSPFPPVVSDPLSQLEYDLMFFVGGAFIVGLVAVGLPLALLIGLVGSAIGAVQAAL